MTFNAACLFCYEDFKKEYGSGIGMIQDCGEYWVFYKKSDEPEYGASFRRDVSSVPPIAQCHEERPLSCPWPIATQ